MPGYSYGDIGIVVLSQPVSTSQVSSYATLPSAGAVDKLPNNQALDYVGYGVQYQAQAPGVKPYDRWAGLRIRNYASGKLIPGTFQGSDNLIKVSMNLGGGNGGTCFGDSGGPDLLGGTSIVLAVNSFVTNSNCSGVGYDTRVDVQARLDWIHTFLAGTVVSGYWDELYQANTYHADITAGMIGSSGTADLTFYYTPFSLAYYVSGSFSKPLDVSDPNNPIEEPWTLAGFLGYSTPVTQLNPFTATGMVACH